MIDYPYTKFIVIGRNASVGDIIRKRSNEYQHADLIAEQLLPMSRAERAAATRELSAGWILGDGPIRQVVVAPDQRHDAARRALRALKGWAELNGIRLDLEELTIAPRGHHEPPAVGPTIRRLLGLHAVTASEASEWLGVSAQALSEIQRGNRQPSLNTLQRLAEFFELPTDRLLQAHFEDLLTRELSDPTRFRAVEARIDAKRSSKRTKR